MAYNEKKTLAMNITAMELAFRIYSEGRKATDLEKLQLREFMGFGGCRSILLDPEQPERWKEYNKPLIPLVKQLHTLVKENTGSDWEYRTMMDSLKESALTSFYTPESFIGTVGHAIYEATGKLPGKMLEPSAGTGRFLHLFKDKPGEENIRKTAYELDLVTGRILQALESDARVRVEGFETIPDNEMGTYDMVVSNIPFGNFAVSDAKMSRDADRTRKEATKRIHNYFFVKGLDALKEGGLLVYLTTRSFSESNENRGIREYMVRHADLVSGIRLYDRMFEDEGIYEIGTDLLIFQKNSLKKELTEEEQLFVETEDYVKRPSRISKDEEVLDVNRRCARNNYFNHNFGGDGEEKHCLGYPTEDLDRFGKETVSWIKDDDYIENNNYYSTYWWELEDLLKRDFSHHYRQVEDALVVEDIPSPQPAAQDKGTPDEVQDGIQQEQMNLWDLFGLTAEERTQIKTTGKHKSRNRSKKSSAPSLPKVEIPQGERVFKAEGYPYTHYKGGTLATDFGQLGVIEMREGVQWFIPTGAHSEEDSNILHVYCQLRDAYWNLFDYEKENGVEQPLFRTVLNNEYEKLVDLAGDLRSGRVAGLCSIDPHYTEIAALERFENGQKVLADIFTMPVNFKLQAEEEQKLTPQEALASSLNLYGEVYLEYMQEKTEMDERSLVEALRGQIYLNPRLDEYEYAGKMIAGNIYRKIDEFKSWIEDLDVEKMNEEERFRFAEMQRTVDVLEKNIPKPIPFEELDFNLGERWIPSDYYSEFVTELFQCTSKANVTYIPNADSFHIDADYNWDITVKWRVKTAHFTKDAHEVLRFAMEDNIPDFSYTVYDYDSGKSVKMVDEEAVQLCSQKMQEMKDLFYEYLDKLPVARKDELAHAYNVRFNAMVRPHYDGSYQTFPGLSFEQFDYDDLYPSQKDAIWMIKQNGGGICDHQVGAGKTMIMCVAAQEMKRLGLVHKPMIIALKANVHEIASTYRKAYPDARILYPSKKDFEKDNRVELFRNIQNNNYDCIILSHEQFGMIPQSLDVQRILMQKELDDVEESLRVMEELSGRWASGRMMSGMEQKKKNLKAKLDNLYNDIRNRQDDEVDFRSMGIDHILIDESHQFKNLKIETRHQRVAGLGNTTGSQRAWNLLTAIRDIQMRTGKDLGATFLSGTTISNSLTELYVLFKYLRPQALEEQRINCFDAWAAIFTRKSTEFEFNVTNKIVQKERFRYFVKVPELAMFYNEVTDYRTADMIGIDRPKKNAIFKNIPPTPEQEAYLPKLMEFAQNGNVELLGGIKPPSDNIKAKMLVATNYSNKMALDMRLIDPFLYENMEGGKVDVAAQTIADYYYRYNEQKGTQFVFSDLGTYRKDEWNIYSAIKDRLVERYNIPENEVAFIQQHDTEKKRTQLFKDMNDGKVRVLFGSTQKLGTGVNAQQRAVALHHLDTPWRPSDLEQREGRAVRKGNLIAKQYANNQVDVITYATEKSLDAYKFNLLQNKQNFINQLKSNQLGSRTLDEGGMDEATGVSFAEYVAVLSGNTDLLDLAKMDRQIKQLEQQRVLYNRETLSMERNLNYHIKDKDENIQKREDMKLDFQYYGQHKDEGFKDRQGVQLSPDEMVKYIRKTARKITDGDSIKLGTFAGASIRLGKTFQISPRLYLSGAVSGREYTQNDGIIPIANEELAGMFHKLMENFPERLNNLEKVYERYVKEIEGMTQMIQERHWPKEEELKEMKAKAAELDARIKEQLKKTENNGEWKEDAEDAQVVESPQAVNVAEPEPDVQEQLQETLQENGIISLEENLNEKGEWYLNATLAGVSETVEITLTPENQDKFWNCHTEEERASLLKELIPDVNRVLEERKRQQEDSPVITNVRYDAESDRLKADVNGKPRTYKMTDEEMRAVASRTMKIEEMAEKVFTSTDGRSDAEKEVFTDFRIETEQQGVFKFTKVKCNYKGMPVARTVERGELMKFKSGEITETQLCKRLFSGKDIEKRYGEWLESQKASSHTVLDEKSTAQEISDWFSRYKDKRVEFHLENQNPEIVHHVGVVTKVTPAKWGDVAFVTFKEENGDISYTRQIVLCWEDQYAIRLPGEKFQNETRLEEQEQKESAEVAVAEEVTGYGNGFKR